MVNIAGIGPDGSLVPCKVNAEGITLIGTDPSTIDPANYDAFGRLRVSEPFTIFDSKQLFDNQPLFWDDQEVSGSGTNSVWSKDKASSVISVSATTAGRRLRQTFRRFNYQPSKSQKVEMTFSGMATASGITKRVGQYDDDNGIFLESADGVVNLVIRSKVTGSVLENRVAQTSWNYDKFDGDGGSGLVLDIDQAQILSFDYEWLGTGTVAIGFVINRKRYYAHLFHQANINQGVYMSTPNLPLRYEIINDGTGAADDFECVCSSVVSEGGQEDNGILQHASTGGTHLDANTIDQLYAVIGMRLKTSHIGAAIKLVSHSIIALTNDDFEVVFVWNPTVAGTFTYADKTNSCLQVAFGDSTNTVSGGFQEDGAMSKAESPVVREPNNSLVLGSAIDGTVDELVMCVRPFSANADIEGTVTWRELS